MNKNLFIMILGLLFSGSIVFGQSIQNSVVASAGGSASAGGVQMDYTLGEVVVETFTSANNQLTQGFHQTNLTLVAIENEAFFADIQVYPNPATDFIQIEVPAQHSQMDFYLYDVSGKLVSAQTNVSSSCIIDVSSEATGTYYLHMISNSEKKQKTYKVIKNK